MNETNVKPGTLMLMPDKTLCFEAHQRLRDMIRDSLKNGETIIIDPTVSIYQFTGARWEPLGPRADG